MQNRLFHPIFRATVCCLLLIASADAFAQKINVSFKFKGIEAGYDHQTRCVLFVDEVETATSEAKLQSKGGKFSAKITPGVHKIRIVNYAQFEGTWEAHTIENDYSQDCTYEAEIDFGNKKSKLEISLIFDLDKGTEAKLGGKNYALKSGQTN